MVTVVTREENGIPLTHEQVDNNFTNLAAAINDIGADVIAEAIAAKDVAVAAAGAASESANSASNSANAASISQGGAALSAEQAAASAASIADLSAPDGATKVGSGSMSVQARLDAINSVLAPTAQPKKILIFGSSVAEGIGATLSQGWAFKLAIAMIAKGYTYVNKSIGGNNTTSLINRFYTDVVPEKPNLVIIGLSLGNEGLAGSSDKEAVYNSYIKGMRRLVGMCRQQGYKVIVTGVYSNNGYTLEDYQYLRQADQELETSDIPYINFLGAVDDGTGKWRAGMYADALHPNNIGHEAMFRAIPLSFIDNLLSPLQFPPYVSNPYTLTMPNTSGYLPLTYISESPFGSFTVMCKVRRKFGAAAGKPIISIESTLNSYTSMRVRNQIDDFVLAKDDTNEIFSTVRSSYNETDHVAVTYDYFTGTWRLYMNGALSGASTYVGESNNYNCIRFGGRGTDTSFSVEGYEFSEMAVWRSALNAEQIVEAMNRGYSKASANLLAPCADAFAQQNSRLVNFVPSDTYLFVGAPGIVATPTASTPGNSYLKLLGGRGFVMPADTTVGPLRYTLTPTNTDFTIFSTIRIPPSGAGGKAIFGFGNAGANVYRTRVSLTGEVEVVDAANAIIISSGRNALDHLPIQVALRYDAARGALELVLDGVQIGTVAVGAFTYSDILFAGRLDLGTLNPTDYEFWSMGAYSILLSDSQLVKATNSEFRKDGISALSIGYEKSYATGSTIENAGGAPGVIAYSGSSPLLPVR